MTVNHKIYICPSKICMHTVYYAQLCTLSLPACSPRALGAHIRQTSHANGVTITSINLLTSSSWINMIFINQKFDNFNSIVASSRMDWLVSLLRMSLVMMQIILISTLSLLEGSMPYSSTNAVTNNT